MTAPAKPTRIDGPAILLAALLVLLVVAIWAIAGLPHARLDRLALMTTATFAFSVAAVVGLWLRHGWAVWCALIAVTLAATIVSFGWSMRIPTFVIATAGALMAATIAMALARAQSLGSTIGPYQRALFAAVFAFAAWVAVWGWFLPADIGRALPISAPPLHARFLGAMYLSGCCYMLLALLARSWDEVDVATAILATWTGLLGLVSIINIGAFDWSRLPTWFWFVAYFGFPLLAVFVLWCQRGYQPATTHPRLPPMVPLVLIVLGGVAAIMGLGLLLAPGAMSRLWPWAIPPILAQIYSAPFLAYGIGCLLAARRNTWSSSRIAMIGTLVFIVGVLVASSFHTGLFNPATPSAWIWFGGFSLAAVALAASAAVSHASAGR